MVIFVRVFTFHYFVGVIKSPTFMDSLRGVMFWVKFCLAKGFVCPVVIQEVYAINIAYGPY